MDAWVGDFVPYLELAPMGWMAPGEHSDMRVLDEPGMTRPLTEALRLLTPSALDRLLETIGHGWLTYSRHDPASPAADAKRREAVLNDDGLTDTQKLAHIEALDGIGRYLEQVDALHPEVDLYELDALSACPIVPWDAADKDTRLDPHNAILVPPRVAEHVRAGLVSFDASGDMVLAPSMLAECICMGVDFNYRLLCLTTRQRTYLAFHRKNVFGSWIAEREVPMFRRLSLVPCSAQHP